MTYDSKVYTHKQWAKRGERGGPRANPNLTLYISEPAVGLWNRAELLDDATHEVIYLGHVRRSKAKCQASVRAREGKG